MAFCFGAALRYSKYLFGRSLFSIDETYIQHLRAHLKALQDLARETCICVQKNEGCLSNFVVYHILYTKLVFLCKCWFKVRLAQSQPILRRYIAS